MMNPAELLRERLEIFDDAVRMVKPPNRVPFVINDAFWRYHDLGYTLSTAIFDSQSIEDAVIGFQQRYQFDLLMDIGDRNPMSLTTSLGNSQYHIDDKNNILFVEEQCHFHEEDYDKFIANPIKTMWEEIIPRKYSLFNSDMELGTLQNALGKFLEYNQALEKTTQRLINECGVPPITGIPNGRFSLAFEVLYDFYRGMRALAGDIRRCPEKVMAFDEVYHETFIKPALQTIKKSEIPPGCFTMFVPMLCQNMLNPKQFEKYFWPHFKEAVDTVVAKNGTMFILSEGTTQHITEYLQELPKGHFCLYVETDDIFERRKSLPNLCFWGGLPISLISKGTREECVDHTKRVIDEVGSNGGLILCTDKFTASPSDCNRENLLAVSEFVRNY